MLESERTRLEDQLSEKVRLINEQKEKIEGQLQTQVKELVYKLKALEEQSVKQQITFEKEIALKDQKLLYIEKESSTLS